MIMPTAAEVAETLGNLTILEIIELTKTLEEKWGVKAEPPVAQVVQAPVKEAPVVEQTEFTITLVSVGARKIEVIKAVRAITALGLSESKAFVESVPAPVKTDVSKAEATDIKAQLEAAGATVEVK
jgi:large subunit ribosomal protein L7/L12